MATATAAHAARSQPAFWRLHRYEWTLAAVGAAACVAATVLLSAEHAVGAGLSSLGAVVFVLVALWCFAEHRTERTLVVFGLYVGMLDGYLKLRTGNQFVTLGRDVLLWAIAGGALWRATGRGNLRLPPLSGLVLAFCVVVLVEVVNPQAPGFVDALGGVRQHLEFVPLFFLGYAVIRSESRLRGTLAILVVCAAANGVVSYAQSTQTPAQLAGWGKGYKERLEGKGAFAGSSRLSTDQNGVTHVRPLGLGSEMGAGAAAAALALPALLVLLITTGGWTRLLIGLLGICIALAVTTSGSRAALVACFVSLLGFGLIAAASRNALRTVIALAFATIVLYAVFLQIGGGKSETAKRALTITPTRALGTYSKERGSSAGRIGSYLSSYPLGVGVGTVGPAAGASGRVFTNPKSFNAETEWNFLALEVGIPGLLLVLAIGGRLVYLAFTRIRRFAAVAIRFDLAALAAPVVAMFVTAFAGPVSATAPSSPYLWFAAGVLAYWLITAFDARHSQG
jgi:hypothetical protein